MQSSIVNKATRDMMKHLYYSVYLLYALGAILVCLGHLEGLFLWIPALLPLSKARRVSIALFMFVGGVCFGLAALQAGLNSRFNILFGGELGAIVGWVVHKVNSQENWLTADAAVNFPE